MSTGNQIEVLNDLIQINNDRIEGYNKAIKNMEDGTDLRLLFSSMVEQSQHFAHDLREEVRKLGGEPEKGTTAAGKIYRTWMDVKAQFGGTDRESILNSCEFGEDAAKNAYKMALENNDLNEAQRDLIHRQQSEQLSAHNRIKGLRDTN